jgi:hypothetical protein
MKVLVLGGGGSSSDRFVVAATIPRRLLSGHRGRHAPSVRLIDIANARASRLCVSLRKVELIPPDCGRICSSRRVHVRTLRQAQGRPEQRRGAQGDAMASYASKPAPGSSLFRVPLVPASANRLDQKRSRRAPARRLIDRVRGEFTEMQGFSPTLDQAARLFSLSRDECHRVFNHLRREGFLGCSADGRYRLIPPRS